MNDDGDAAVGGEPPSTVPSASRMAAEYKPQAT
jgi:hypothetical protein